MADLPGLETEDQIESAREVWLTRRWIRVHEPVCPRRRSFQMRTGFIGSIVVGIAALAVTPALLAQSAPRSGTAKADLSGIWNRRAVSDRFGTFADDPGGVPFLGFGKGVPPLRSEGMDKYKANRQGIADARANGRDDIDPLSRCLRPGPSRIFALPRPLE